MTLLKGGDTAYEVSNNKHTLMAASAVRTAKSIDELHDRIAIKNKETIWLKTNQ